MPDVRRPNLGGLVLALGLPTLGSWPHRKFRQSVSVIPREPFRGTWDVCRITAPRLYWRAEAVRLRALWWLQDWAVMPIARRSAARWSAGKSVPAWWRAFLIVLLTRADD